MFKAKAGAEAPANALMEVIMNTSRNYYIQEARRLSVWRFALKHGLLRLGSEAVIAIWLVLLLRKVELTTLEFFVPLVICPLIFFLYAVFIWWIKHDKAEDSDT